MLILRQNILLRRHAKVIASSRAERGELEASSNAIRQHAAIRREEEQRQREREEQERFFALSDAEVLEGVDLEVEDEELLRY
jgi:hypothetical protein